jgi:hypothetical protein
VSCWIESLVPALFQAEAKAAAAAGAIKDAAGKAKTQLAGMAQTASTATAAEVSKVFDAIMRLSEGNIGTPSVVRLHEHCSLLPGRSARSVCSVVTHTLLLCFGRPSC